MAMDKYHIHSSKCLLVIDITQEKTSKLEQLKNFAEAQLCTGVLGFKPEEI